MIIPESFTLEVESLRTTMAGGVTMKGDPEYDLKRLVWNRTRDRNPALVVTPTGVSDIVRAVRFAKEKGLPIAVKSGGHHVAGLGSCDDGLVIDMSQMRAVIVDPDRREVLVQGGATAADVIRETQAFALAIPTGNLGGVGMAGLTTGGGMGYMRRRYGLTCDNLVGADLVLADGRFLHASETEHPDLFWAIRGGGGNFGVVVALRCRLHPVGPEVAAIRTIYRGQDMKRVLTGCRDYLLQGDHNVSINIDLMAFPPLPQIPPALVGQRAIIVSGMHAGPNLEDALKAVQPLAVLAEPLMNETGPMTYQELHGKLDAMLPPGHMGYMESTYVKDFSDELIDDVTDVLETASAHNIIMLWPLGGQMAEISAQATAFGDRRAALVMSVESMWQDPKDAEEGTAWVHQTRTALRPHQYNGGTYLNLAGCEENIHQVVRKTYGENYERLVRIKKTYDPDNIFRFNANIDPNG